MSNMRKIFADTIIDMMQVQSLNSITVTDIVNQCGVSRQSFYYYFDDIYDLIEWIYMQETERALNEFSDIDSWQTGYIRIMRWAQDNKVLVMNTFRSIQREYIEIFMYRVLYQYIIKVVKTEAEDINVTEEQCKYIAKFYTLAINSISLEWIKNNMDESPEDVAEKVNFMIEGDFKKALLKFQDTNR